MPFTLIPDGFELKKVTALQKQAVDEYFGRERHSTNINSILSNPATMQLVGVGALGLGIATYLPLFIEALEAKVGTLSDDFKEGINETINEFNPLNKVREFMGTKTNEELIAELEKRAEAKKEIEFTVPGI